MNAVKMRPLVRYHGGKWKLADWILSHFPPHRIYTETFGGGASVLLKKARSYAEIYNDLDGEIVNLFRVARDNGLELRRLLEMTPFAREEFVAAYEPSSDPIEQARRTICRAFMGHSSSAVTRQRKTTTRFNLPTTGFRANSNRSGTTPARDWMNYPDSFALLIERLRGVIIENRPAMDVMAAHDSAECLHYIDPPYLQSTRDPGSDYKYEMTDLEHIELLKFVKGLKGKVIVSGYNSSLYCDMLAGWRCETKTGPLADGAGIRTECLWINYDHSRLL